MTLHPDSRLWLETKKKCLEERNVCFGEEPADKQIHIICCTWTKHRTAARFRSKTWWRVSARLLILYSGAVKLMSAGAERSEPLPGLHRARRWCQSRIPAWGHGLSAGRQCYCWDRLDLIRQPPQTPTWRLLHYRQSWNKHHGRRSKGAAAQSCWWLLSCSISCNTNTNYFHSPLFFLPNVQNFSERSWLLCEAFTSVTGKWPSDPIRPDSQRELQSFTLEHVEALDLCSTRGFHGLSCKKNTFCTQCDCATTGTPTFYRFYR